MIPHNSREDASCARPPAAPLVLLAIGLAALSPSMAAGDQPRALLAATGQGQALVMPLDAAPGVLAAGRLHVEVVIENGFRTYRVHHQGQLHTAHAPLNGPPRRFAFDLARQRFEEVAQTLLLRLNQEEDMAAVIAATDALGGKSYPALGWALLRLPAAANPAEVAQRLQAEGLVAAAEVRLKGAVYVPQ